MSILKKLLGGILRSLVSQPVPSAPVATSAPTPHYTQPPQYNTGDEHFAAIITQENFPGYTIQTGLHPREFDPAAHPSCLPVSYLFRKDGAPCLAVMVMNKNQYQSMIARGTYQILDAMGIPRINFYRNMENAPAYVLERIRDNL